MEPLLFLVHRLPYPPNKGDKVRSYHFLRHLAERHDVYLGTFIDDPSDWQHVETLRAICREVHVESIVPWRKRLVSASGLLGRKPLTLPYFRSAHLQRWVDDCLQRLPTQRVFAYSSPMAQYVRPTAGARLVADFVDLDSAKWAEYAGTCPWPLSAIYAREARLLLDYERRVAQTSHAVLFVTEEERKLFCGDACGSVFSIRNGVDSSYFSPSLQFDSPYAAEEQAVVFTGAMDYWPNIDAVTWFSREVLPLILQSHRQVKFYIVGMNPDANVRSLANGRDVIVTGRVADVRPYLCHARVVVAPLRIARGIQNKVLEAMAMARPIVVTGAAAASIKAEAGTEIAIADDASTFAREVIALLDPERARTMARRARARVLRDYAWEASLARLDAVTESAWSSPLASDARMRVNGTIGLATELAE